MAKRKSIKKAVKPVVKREGNRLVSKNQGSMSVRDMKAQPIQDFEPNIVTRPRRS